MSDHAYLFADLEGFYAYDMGATDSGIHHPVLRKQRANELDKLLETPEGNRVLSEWVATTYLSDEAAEAGYGWEDALSFLQWINSGDYR